MLGPDRVHMRAISFHFFIMCSSLGLTKEKPENAAWSMESMRFLSAWERRGFSLRNSRSKLLQSLGDFCGWQFRDFSQVNVTKHTEAISILDACIQIYTIGFQVPQYLFRNKIIGSYHFRLKRRIHFSLLQCWPIDCFEERVHTDVSHHTQPATGVSLKQLQ